MSSKRNGLVIYKNRLIFFPDSQKLFLVFLQKV
ncbi:MAG: hypothetical protein ACI9QN_002382, partial [Arcticibacterium sp.]